MAIDFSTTYPWSTMETVTIDGQAMVKIPKFYVKYGVIPAGRPNAGKKGRWVSEKKFPDYHIHPAFVKNGYVMDCFYIASYEAYNAGSNKAGSAPNQTPWTNVGGFANAKTYCANRGEGWHLQNIYEIGTVNILLLIELGTPNVQTAIAMGNVNSSSNAVMATGTTDAVWRDIHEWWGNVYEHVDGITTSGNNVYQIFSNKMDGTYVSTGVALPSEGWTTEMSEEKGTNFDLTDVFLPSVADSTESNGTYGDYSNSANISIPLCSYRSGMYNENSKAGAFYLRTRDSYNNSYEYLGFRLAKEGTVTEEVA